MKALKSKKDVELWQTISSTFESERKDMFRYACYKLGNAEDAEDALQDMFLTLHSKSGLLNSVKNIRGYIYRSLSNLCTDILRGKQKLQTVPIENLRDISNDEPENFEQEFRRISTLLSSIPDEQAEVIRMRIYGNKSFIEIAEILEMPITSVRSRFVYGIDKIKKGLKHDNLHNK